MFNDKLHKYIGLVVIFCVLVGTYFLYYRRTHPKYVPLPPRPEITLTIIPGWNLRQVAEYLVIKGYASSTKNVYKLTGEPARENNFEDSTTTLDLADGLLSARPVGLSLEGYLAPETVRFFADASLETVIEKFYAIRKKEITSEMFAKAKTLHKNFNQILTMASLLEEEVKSFTDKKMVADILWRRYQKNWALQLDSTVHYVVGKTGTVFTTGKEREVDSPWNTYKYPGLPLGPICNPSIESIKATLEPTANSYWYFLTGKDGKVYYAKTLEEHNANKRYLY